MLYHLPCVDTANTHAHISLPTFLGKQCHLSDFHFLCNGLFPSGPSCLVPSSTFSGTCTPFPEEQPRGRQMRSCGLFTVYPQGARFPQGCSERCPGGVQCHLPQALRETPTSPQKVRSGRRLRDVSCRGFTSFPSGRTLLKVAQRCSLALAFLTGPVHLPWSKDEELDA